MKIIAKIILITFMLQLTSCIPFVNLAPYLGIPERIDADSYKDGDALSTKHNFIVHANSEEPVSTMGNLSPLHIEPGDYLYFEVFGSVITKSKYKIVDVAAGKTTDVFSVKKGELVTIQINEPILNFTLPMSETIIEKYINNTEIPIWENATCNMNVREELKTQGDLKFHLSNLHPDSEGKTCYGYDKDLIFYIDSSYDESIYEQLDSEYYKAFTTDEYDGIPEEETLAAINQTQGYEKRYFPKISIGDEKKLIHRFTAKKDGTLKMELVGLKNNGALYKGVTISKALGEEENEGDNGGLEIFIVDKDDKIISQENITGTEFSYTARQKGKVLLRVKDNSDYKDNLGFYFVKISKRYQPDIGIANGISKIVNPVFEAVDKATELIYKNIAQSEFLKKFVRISLALYIMAFGMAHVLGMTRQPTMEVIIKSLKITVLIILISPQSWEFFNEYFFKLFRDGGFWLISAMLGYESSPIEAGLSESENVNNYFKFIDYGIMQFFHKNNLIKITTFIWLFPVGWIFIYILFNGIITFFFISVEAVIAFMLGFIGMSFLIAMGPIFISLMLFNQTKRMFENWYKYIFALVIQPVLLITFIIFISNLLSIAFNNILNFTALWDKVFVIDFFGLFNIPFYSFKQEGYELQSVLPFIQTLGYGYDVTNFFESMAASFTLILPNVIVFQLFVAILKKSGDVISEISGFLTETRFGSVALMGRNSASDNIFQKAAGAVGQDRESRARRGEN